MQNVAPAPTSFSGDISDLFFNLDHSANKKMKNGLYDGFDEEKLKIETEWFLASLRRLGVGCLPTSEQLVADFLKRI